MQSFSSAKRAPSIWVAPPADKRMSQSTPRRGPRRLSRAFTAAAVERDFVALHHKTCGRQTGQIAWARVHIKHFFANCTLKVMVVTVVSHLIHGIATRQMHLTQQALIGHGFEGTVYRSNPQARQRHLRQLQHVLRCQWSVCLRHCLLNGNTLLGGSLHGRIHGIRVRERTRYCDHACTRPVDA